MSFPAARFKIDLEEIESILSNSLVIIWTFSNFLSLVCDSTLLRLDVLHFSIILCQSYVLRCSCFQLLISANPFFRFHGCILFIEMLRFHLLSTAIRFESHLQSTYPIISVFRPAVVVSAELKEYYSRWTKLYASKMKDVTYYEWRQ